MKIGIIGCGMVGGTLAKWFEENTDHEIFKKDPEKGFMDSFGDIDCAFVAIPVWNTDPGERAIQDQRELFECVKWLGIMGDFPIFIKSTVLPGTCDRLSSRKNPVFAMPEFLSEKTAYEDFCAQPIIIGDSAWGSEIVFSHLFPEKEIILLSNREAEMAKYAHNCFGAMKVGYFNLIEKLCTIACCDFDRVRDAILQSGYISPVHTQVPGHDGLFGFGGKCLPKDLHAFQRFVRDQSGEAGLLALVEQNNFYDRTRAL